MPEALAWVFDVVAVGVVVWNVVELGFGSSRRR